MTQSFISFSDTKQLYNAAQALPLIVVTSPKCYAVISLYGGQILEFKPTDKPALLWLSPVALFEPGKAIRGGVPLCAPWFGPHRSKREQNSDLGKVYPNHGFARTSVWTKTSAQANQDHSVTITLALKHSEQSALVYPHQFTMELEFTLGDELTIEFAITNHSTATIECEWAMHSYFAIDNIATAAVNGLDGYQYVDSANNANVEQLNGALTFNGEVDRYFITGSASQTIENSTPISISGTNCNSVITWNPGAELAEKMPDISDKFYQQFVCVERGAIFENQWLIAPAQKQSARMVLSN